MNIDPTQYAEAKASNRLTTAVVNGQFQATYAETDNFGNPVTPVVQSSSLQVIQSATTTVNATVGKLQSDLRTAQTVLANQQALLADAQAAITAAAAAGKPQVQKT
jgi:hypothetical protein